MTRHKCSLILFCLLLKTAAASDGNLSQTAVGWSGVGGDLTGIPQQVTDIWTGRSSWNDLGSVGWPTTHAGYMAYIQANPNGAVDFATALIPHGLPSSQWNGLLDEVVSGAHDSVFVDEGKNIAKYSTNTVFCRPWWEMTIDTGNLDPTKFKAAWNHAVPILRAAFAAAAPSKTFKVVYCYLPDATGDPKAYFPGPENVDVIDADIYGKVWGKTTPTQEAMLASVQKELNYLAAFAAAQNKPMGISEWANMAIKTQGQADTQGRGDDPEYIDLMLSFAAQNHFLYMVYYNIAVGGTGQTLADTPVALAHFRAALTPTPAISTFSAWQTRYFAQTQLANSAVSGPNADPYGSGIPNLFAYALQLDPSTAQPSDIPQPTPNNGHLTMTYQVPSKITDVRFIPEVSSDLRTWDSTTAAVQVISTTVGTNGTTITVKDCLLSSTKARFMRLRVTQRQ